MPAKVRIGRHGGDMETENELGECAGGLMDTHMRDGIRMHSEICWRRGAAEWLRVDEDVFVSFLQVLYRMGFVDTQFIIILS